MLAMLAVTGVKTTKAQTYGDITNNSTQVEVDRDFDLWEAGKETGKYTAAGGTLGFTVGTLIPGVGNAAGFAVGSGVGAVTGFFGYVFNNTEDALRYTMPDGTTVDLKCEADSKECFYMQGEFRGCKMLPMKLEEQRKCFFCPLFAVIFKAADNMAVLSFSKLAPSFAYVIVMGLGLYFAFMTLAHVSSLTKQDAPKFLGSLIKQSFKFIVAYLLLMYMNQVYYYLVNPLLNGGLAFGKSLLFLSDGAGSYPASQTVDTTLFSPDLYGNLDSFISQVQVEISFMQAIGTSLMCVGGNSLTGINGDGFASGFLMVFQGLLIAGFGFLLSLAFAFYLIDAVVQLGIVGALMPFLIASWPFKLTSKYTSTGFSMMMNSFFVFVFLGLVVSVCLQLVSQALTSEAPVSPAADQNYQQRQANVKSYCSRSENAGTDYCIKFMAGQGKETTAEIKKKNDYEESTNKYGALKGIYEAINGQQYEKLKDLTDISGIGFMILVICCIFGFKFCAQASSLAGSMASGGIQGIGSSIGTMAASAATNAAKTTAKPVVDAAAQKIGDGRRAAWKWGKGKVKSAFSGKGEGSSEESGTPENSETQSNSPNSQTSTSVRSETQAASNQKKPNGHENGTPNTFNQEIKPGTPGSDTKPGGNTEETQSQVKPENPKPQPETPQAQAARAEAARSEFNNNPQTKLLDADIKRAETRQTGDKKQADYHRKQADEAKARFMAAQNQLQNEPGMADVDKKQLQETVRVNTDASKIHTETADKYDASSEKARAEKERLVGSRASQEKAFMASRGVKDEAINPDEASRREGDSGKPASGSEEGNRGIFDSL